MIQVDDLRQVDEGDDKTAISEQSPEDEGHKHTIGEERSGAKVARVPVPEALPDLQGQLAQGLQYPEGEHILLGFSLLLAHRDLFDSRDIPFLLLICSRLRPMGGLD